MIPVKSLFPSSFCMIAVSLLMAGSLESSIWVLQTEQDIEEFKVLGEKAYYKKCTQGKIADILKDLYKSIGMVIM